MTRLPPSKGRTNGGRRWGGTQGRVCDFSQGREQSNGRYTPDETGRPLSVLPETRCGRLPNESTSLPNESTSFLVVFSAVCIFSGMRPVREDCFRSTFDRRVLFTLRGLWNGYFVWVWFVQTLLSCSPLVVPV